MMLAGIGIFASIIGTSIVRTKDDATMGNLLWSLRFGIFGAGILALIGTGIYILMNDSAQLRPVLGDTRRSCGRAGDRHGY